MSGALDAGKLWAGGLATAGVAALTAIALLHLLAATTPSASRYFGWIRFLLPTIATVVPLALDAPPPPGSRPPPSTSPSASPSPPP